MSRLSAPTSLDHHQVVRLLIEWGGCAGAAGGTDGLRDRVVADYLRHHICLLGQPSTPDGLPGAVHLSRLRAAVRRQLGTLGDWFADDAGPVWQDLELDAEDGRVDLRELDLRMFRLLEFLGEIAHRGQGYYLPTPLRLVPLWGGGALVIGGPPTWVVRCQLGLVIGWAGLGRTLSHTEAARAPATIPRQPRNAWMGVPAPGLIPWTEQLLQETRRGLRPAGSQPEPGTYQIYHPQRSDTQIGRWMSPSEWRPVRSPASELWLCRSSNRPRRFWLTPLRSGPAFDLMADLAPEHARRLMYGLDKRADRSVNARVNPTRDPGIREVTLGSWPAWGELRLLLALGHRRIELDNRGQLRHLPLRFWVAETWWPDVREALQGLCIRIVEESTPNP